MISDIHQKLMTAKIHLREAKKLQSMYELICRDLRAERERGKSLEERLKSEKADVDKLEGFSLTGLFGSLIGSKQEWLDVEQEEYLRAQLNYDTHLRVLEGLELKFQEINTSLRNYDAAEAEYERILEEKRKALLRSSGEETLKMMALAEKIADLKSELKEINEATSAGNTALASLKSVASSLSSAENWGTVDLLGGGILSTAMKHSKLDDAKRNVQNAQVRLKYFQEELNDAGKRLQLSISVDGFSKFADFFFDGLIFDWSVQSGINKAMSNCKSVITKVENALSSCRRKALELQDLIDELKQEKRQFIEEA
mgnify:CR=1 FL=1